MRKLLYPFSLMYGTVAWIRNRLYDQGIIPSYKAGIRVIAVGNISTGGTGKTPLAEYILSALQKNSEGKIAYLSRGYGRQTKGFLVVNPQSGNALKYGDEAIQVAGKFPEVVVAVCEDRNKGIQELINQHKVSLVVLDDAFQHRKVQRDVNIVVMDATRMPDRDLVLPAGNLREQISELKRADLLVVNKVLKPDDIPSLEKRLERFHKPVAFCQPGFHQWVFPFQPPARKQTAFLFSGIGNPDSFYRLVQKQNIGITNHLIFRDHYPYRQPVIEEIIEDWQRSGADMLLTTEKDFSRISGRPFFGILKNVPFGYVKIRLKWLKGEEHIHEALQIE